MQWVVKGKQEPRSNIKEPFALDHVSNWELLEVHSIGNEVELADTPDSWDAGENET